MNSRLDEQQDGDDYGYEDEMIESAGEDLDDDKVVKNISLVMILLVRWKRLCQQAASLKGAYTCRLHQHSFIHSGCFYSAS